MPANVAKGYSTTYTASQKRGRHEHARSSFVADGSIPLNQRFLLFFAGLFMGQVKPRGSGRV